MGWLEKLFGGSTHKIAGGKYHEGITDVKTDTNHTLKEENELPLNLLHNTAVSYLSDLFPLALLCLLHLFTQRSLLRIYPKGIRFDSSNYNHFVAWTHGAQMVAFNMQDKISRTCCQFRSSMKGIRLS
ncbi:hypothetical protein K7X08_036942 [Anisodus acutangulus]|uniref:Phosphoinositide phospholipase C n=1 Tax=Anisodus acutangulus TaxID=402998 RepID=A0A9Q1L9B2_9SOLA|nr:hypothetical protein K7X08_036942 [Anisodus acutangulus]